MTKELGRNPPEPVDRRPEPTVAPPHLTVAVPYGHYPEYGHLHFTLDDLMALLRMPIMVKQYGGECPLCGGPPPSKDGTGIRWSRMLDAVRRLDDEAYGRLIKAIQDERDKGLPPYPYGGYP